MKNLISVKQVLVILLVLFGFNAHSKEAQIKGALGDINTAVMESNSELDQVRAEYNDGLDVPDEYYADVIISADGVNL